MSDADDECVEKEGTDCGGDDQPWLLGVLILYIVGFIAMSVTTVIMRTVQEYERWSESRERSTSTCIRKIVFKILSGLAIASVWPVLFLGILFYWTPRRLYRSIVRRFGRSKEETFDIRQHVKIATRGGKWADRGWIVMLRARHRRSLASPTTNKLFRIWSTLLFRKKGTTTGLSLPRPAVREDQRGETAGEVQLAEMGQSNRVFSQAVVAIVEIEEEGLFRNIIAFL